jgi:prepilin-type N-terminal cleavage/methylation domain-containing protein
MHMSRARTALRRQRGYNLVETLIAMALLGTVLLSVMTLFVWGRKNVYSGKQMTRAVAVGTRVMEDLSALTRSNVEDAFNLTAFTLDDVDIAGETYEDSILRVSTETTNDPMNYLSRWNALLGQENFANGLVSMVITPVDPEAASGTPASISGSPIYRIRVYVQWNEETRRRSIVFDTTKVDRLN